MRLVVHDVTAAYRAPGGGILPALGPVKFEIVEKTFVSLVGPSGCGKSTLVRILAGLQQPSQGSAQLDGQRIAEPSPRIGIMFQDANLMPWRTVIDNIALPLEIAGIPDVGRKRRALDLLPGLGLMGFEAAYPGELSGGMAQRVALGRVLIQEPDVLLLDEPFGALDAMTREKISLDLLRMLAKSHQTVFMVTHDIREAVLLSDRVLVMSRRPGRIIADVVVALPRPRHLEITFSDPFNHLTRHIREAIDRA